MPFDFESVHNNLEGARTLDSEDPLSVFRKEFSIPSPNGESESSLYFAGHSLGPCPLLAEEYLQKEIEDWKRWGVEGHMQARHPWLPYHENITHSFARLVGAQPAEVVAMNTLTVNLHLMLVSFYRPTPGRHKILIENNTFPSDKYAVDSQARFHGFDPETSVVCLKPNPGEMVVSPESIINQIEELGDELALILLGNCNYLSGQCFDMESIVKTGHAQGALVGFNLAHGAGNLSLNLHDWDVDFAVWCTYKYLNSGPGGLAGAFIHDKHLRDPKIPRFEGWWGTNKDTRFKMEPNFDPIPTAEAWQLSNPPIWQLATLRASMTLFDRATMPALRKKGDLLTSYLEWLIKTRCGEALQLVTPAHSEDSQQRGSMLCYRLRLNTEDSSKSTPSTSNLSKSNPSAPALTSPQAFMQKLKDRGIIIDFREPDIFRICPAPLYTQFEDIFHLVQNMENCLL